MPLMLSIGTKFRFEMPVFGVGGEDRTTKQSWPATHVIGTRPILQSTGPDSDQVQLRGILYPLDDRTRRNWPAELRNLQAAGVAYIIMDGRGRKWPGKWAITQLQETRSAYLDNGAPRRVAWTMVLERVGGENG